MLMRYSLFCCVLFAGVFAGCRSFELPGHWRDHEVVIDGKNSDWEFVTTLDDKQTYIGTMNDGTFLYVVLTTWNRNYQQQIIRDGLIVWLDKDAEEKNDFGIHYPLGVGGAMKRPGGGSRRDDRGTEGDTPGILMSMNELEICGPGKDERHRMTMAEAAGIEARMHSGNESLIYELKVPLKESGGFPFAIGTKPGSQISVGFEIPYLKKTVAPAEGVSDDGSSADGGFGEHTGVGSRAGGGGRGGGRRQGGGGMRGEQQSSSPLNLWAKLTLAMPKQAQ